MSGAAEVTIRLCCFFGILAVMAAWEVAAPCRALTVSKAPRWFSNLGLVVLNSFASRLFLPLTAVGAARLGEQTNWGLLHLLKWPTWCDVVVAILLLDLAVYLQHVMSHAVPLFWRLHMVHHADLDFDVTTGLRFHTIEILLSGLIKLGVVAVLGPPPVAVVVFEVLLNATSMFNHGNVRLPLWLDRLVRLVLVTPDMHRVHHSVVPRETNSNFGFNLPWWDFLLGTYRPQPAAGHDRLVIGLSQFRDECVERLPWMLLLPFVGSTGEYPLNRTGGKGEPLNLPQSSAGNSGGNGGRVQDVADHGEAKGEAKGATHDLRAATSAASTQPEGQAIEKD